MTFPSAPVPPPVPVRLKRYDFITRLNATKRFLPFAVFLIIVTAGLLGCLSIYSARAMTEAPMYFVLRQICWLGAGALVFTAAAAIPFGVYKSVAPYLLAFAAATLLLVLFCGKRINSMSGWFDLFGVCLVQPSEFAKCSFLLFMSVCAAKGEKLSAGRFAALLLVASVFVVLLMLEPDFGGALMFFSAFLIVVLVRGISFSCFAGALAVMSVCAAVFIVRNEYAFLRILAYLDPENAANASAWHIHQFQYTLAHGSWTGSEWGSALWSSAFLPLPHTDSLFASIVESTGFLGGLLVILCFAGMALGFTVMSWKIRDDAGKLFVFSAGMLYFFQSLIHISVNCVLIPPTGVTLPMLSYGGSSLLSVMLCFGIAFSAAADE